MTKRSALKGLGTDYEEVVSTPARVESITLCNKSDQPQEVEIRMTRGTEAFRLFGATIRPKTKLVVFEGKDRAVNVQGSDFIDARSSSAGAVDLTCSYQETAGSSPLFNSLSWNDRESWATARNKQVSAFSAPEFVIKGLNSGASRWRSSSTYQKWVYDAVVSILPGWNGLELENYTQINANNGYLAACGVNLYVSGGGIVNAVSFDLQVNVFYAQQLTQDEWDDVMAHEMGHGLGIGIFWTSSSFFLESSSYPSTQKAYNSITSLDRTKTPLESSGGSGTASAHWENDFRLSSGTAYYGVSDELMVGALVQGGMVLSDLSLGALKDFGYEAYPSAEGRPNLSTSTGVRSLEGALKCGLSSRRIDRMMGLLKNEDLATCGKLTLKRYISS